MIDSTQPKKMATISLVIVFIVFNLFGEGFSYAFFSTYTQRVCRVKDSCVRITQCHSYMVLFDNLKRPLNPNSLVFLRHQECGFEAGLPKVCCLLPSSKNPHPYQHQAVSTSVQDVTVPTASVEKNVFYWKSPRDNRDTGEAVKQEDQLRRKVDAINQAFAFSSMDDFFARKITDKPMKANLS